MRAVVMRSNRLVVDEVPDPRPVAGQVLARVLACGICGSDLHALTHLDAMIDLQRRTGGTGSGLDPSRDLIMGHEFCAEVVDSASAPTLRPGTRVCSMPMSFATGSVQAIGYSNDLPGGYGELVVLDEALCLPVPGDLPTELAALTEPLAVGRHAVEKATLSSGDVPLVIGCGPVGLAVIAALRQRGVGPIVAADFSPARRRLAETFGADVVVDPAESSPYQRWQDLAWPPGADRSSPLIRVTGPFPRPGVVFECVGVPGVLAAALEGAMRNTRVIVVGVCMEEDRFQPMLAIGKELELRFVLGYTPAEFTDTLRALADGELDVGRLITGEVDLDGTPGAFEALRDPEAHAKILVRP